MTGGRMKRGKSDACIANQQGRKSVHEGTSDAREVAASHEIMLVKMGKKENQSVRQRKNENVR